jgi:signal transduction histidine kinase
MAHDAGTFVAPGPTLWSGSEREPAISDLASSLATRYGEPTVRLLDMLVHDLRQPLTSMSMNVQTALRALSGKRPRVTLAIAALQDALTAESHAAHLLRTEQIERLASRDLSIDIGAIAADVKRLLSTATATWGQRIELDLNANVWALTAHPLEFRHAILHLVLAGLDALEPDKDGELTRLRLTTRQVSSQHVEIRLSGLPASALRSDRDFWTPALGGEVARSVEGYIVVESLHTGVVVKVLLPAGIAPGRAASIEDSAWKPSL